ncbi:MAG: alpha/beta hydrolase [Streptosporangiaceae bacterium]
MPGLLPRTAATADAVTFRLADSRPARARVWLDLDHHGRPPDMVPVPGGWELRIARPPVQRLEYLFAVTYPDGAEAMICDPAAPRAAGPFGDHSVLTFPGYREPGWLAAPAVAGSVSEHEARAPGPPGPVPVTLWSPAGTAAAQPLPLLVLHDGPEYDRYALVTLFCAAAIAAGTLPPHRVALLGPGDRNQWYAANPGYARTLTQAVLPFLRATVAVSGPVALGGFSLGALAALHAAWQVPGTFGALFLQSGSFFREETDPQESGFGGFAAVTSFVAGLPRTPPAAACDITMTCGLAEENLASNRLLAGDLAALGYRVVLAEVPDAHTFTGWRDALDPHLTRLLRRAWRRPGCRAAQPGGDDGHQRA